MINEQHAPVSHNASMFSVPATRETNSGWGNFAMLGVNCGKEAARSHSTFGVVCDELSVAVGGAGAVSTAAIFAGVGPSELLP